MNGGWEVLAVTDFEPPEAERLPLRLSLVGRDFTSEDGLHVFLEHPCRTGEPGQGGLEIKAIRGLDGSGKFGVLSAMVAEQGDRPKEYVLRSYSAVFLRCRTSTPR